MFQIIIALAVVAALFAAAFYFAPKGWRTWAFNALASLPVIGLPLTDALLGFDWSALVDRAEAAAYALAVTVSNAVLRAVTTTPPGKSE